MSGLATSRRLPHAGKRFTARVRVQLPEGVQPGSAYVRCAASVEGSSLLVVGKSFEHAVATCTWAVPRGTAGKRLAAVIKVSASGKSARQALARTVAGNDATR